MYYPNIQINSLEPGFSALPMNPLLDVHEQEHGWKIELQECARDFYGKRILDVGAGLGSRFQITHFQFGNRHGPCDLSILSRQLEFEIVNMHVDELQTQKDSHHDMANLCE